MKKVLMLIVLLSLTACKGQGKNDAKDEVKPEIGQTKMDENSKFKVKKTEAEWQAELTSEQYDVLRNKATERPHTGEYNDFFEDGVYVCAACSNPLFKSDTKFDSHCGWPSFDQAIEGSVVYEHDTSYGMDRTEVMCANCGGHLGHVFDDGPKETTGDRFCTNSVSIKFIPAKK
ncbi:peptide-methionine (R)-S-oxide reductase MsrB [Flavobacterium salilacus subsp. salilacus]|uniref:peptide-methionine (R)-S-oxide reductase MsrB n=1 Tax=Flavobacterium TaxID=237 RepID=UPI001074BE6A|nr:MULTISPECIES: peptide-methionine (R)-S-oxide reductase MsrB [Flavobacterium]KAF2517556.1 peptide-methionine (R)-S-oxide reductase MsrB [Flavobacterium salilacus subsp. salilacus]MBE1615705.1 peptide-methionine (R)-S-oxide reductase MsrB [Flavobacterium sp. SaA2.13]